MKIDFTNKTTLVVGGSAGIGLKIKEEFQNLGSNVYLYQEKKVLILITPNRWMNFYFKLIN